MLVYQLQASGEDAMGCVANRTVYNTVLFTTQEGAESRVEKFRAACSDRIVDPKIKIVPMEVID